MLIATEVFPGFIPTTAGVIDMTGRTINSVIAGISGTTPAIMGIGMSAQGDLIGARYDDTAAGNFRIFNFDGATITANFSATVGNDLNLGGTVRFSPSGQHVAVGTANSSPYMRIWKQNAGSWTELTTLSGGNALFSAVDDADYIADGSLLAVCNSPGEFNSGIPAFAVYSVSGDVYTRMAAPAIAELGPRSQSLRWSPDGTHLAIGLISAGSGNTLHVYSNSSGVLTKLTNPTQPSNNVSSVSYSSDGQYLAVTSYGSAANATQHLLVYERSGDTYTVVAAINLPGFPSRSWARFSPLNDIIFTSGTTGVYLITNTGGTFAYDSQLTNEAASHVMWSVP
jgi:WD40 repeat protein